MRFPTRHSFRFIAALMLLSTSVPTIAFGQAAAPTPMLQPPAAATMPPGNNIPPPPPPSGAGGGLGGGQGGAAPPPPPPSNIQLATSLVGVWRGQGMDGGAPVNLQIMITDDGRFQQWTVFQNGFTVQIWGTYQITPVAPTNASVYITPSGWQPTQFCGATGACMPLTYQPTTTQVTIIDANTIQNNLGTMRRVQ